MRSLGAFYIPHFKLFFSVTITSCFGPRFCKDALLPSAPLAEEIYFRRVLYGWLRRFGPAVAVICSTLVYVAAHPNLVPIPIKQFIGGLVFAIFFEIEKNLMVPILVHGLDNALLFSLSLLT